jgi:hypothetical protein
LIPVDLLTRDLGGEGGLGSRGEGGGASEEGSEDDELVLNTIDTKGLETSQATAVQHFDTAEP